MSRAGIYGEIQLERTEIALSGEALALRDRLRDAAAYRDPALWAALADAYTKQQLYREAVEALGMCLSFDCFRVDAYMNRGNCSLKLMRFQEAAADFSLVVSLDTGNYLARQRLGIALCLMGDYARGREALEQALESTPVGGDFGFQVAVFLWYAATRLGDRACAEEAVVAALDRFQTEDEYAVLCRMLAGHSSPNAVLELAEGSGEPVQVNLKAGVALYLHENGDETRARVIMQELADPIDGVITWHTLGAHMVRLYLGAER